MSNTGLLFDRFWSKVDRCGPDDCWPWLAGFFKPKYTEDRYGKFHLAGKFRRAHAVALELASGEKASGRQALHACDNPSCCNPAHLFWGTNLENNADKVRKKRHCFGETQKGAKLTDEVVLAIRARYVPRSKDNNAASLAEVFGVSVHTIRTVVQRQKWTHLH